MANGTEEAVAWLREVRHRVNDENIRAPDAPETDHSEMTVTYNR